MIWRVAKPAEARPAKALPAEAEELKMPDSDPWDVLLVIGGEDPNSGFELRCEQYASYHITRVL